MTRVRTVLPGAIANRLPAKVATHRVNWIEVARTDCVKVRKSWLLPVLLGSFLTMLLFAPMIPVLHPMIGDQELRVGVGIMTMVWVIRWLVPLTALIVGSMAVVSDREEGNLRVLLGLPVSRLDVSVGTLLGRSIVVSAVLLTGLLFAGAELWYFYSDFDLGTYVIFVMLTILYGLIFVSVGIGISLAFSSRARAVGAAVSVFALIGFLWRAIPAGMFYLKYGDFPTNNDSVAWFVFLGNVNPQNGFLSLVQKWIAKVNVAPHQPAGPSLYQGMAIEGGKPLYLYPEFVLIVLSLWGIIPLVLGAWRFSRSDLG